MHVPQVVYFSSGHWSTFRAAGPRGVHEITGVRSPVHRGANEPAELGLFLVRQANVAAAQLFKMWTSDGLNLTERLFRELWIGSTGHLIKLVLRSNLAGASGSRSTAGCVYPELMLALGDEGRIKKRAEVRLVEKVLVV
jgi:hypothetical protein